MKYNHPEKYQGEWMSHESICKYVEYRCIKCDKFMGKDHDFEECKILRKKPWQAGKMISCGVSIFAKNNN